MLSSCGNNCKHLFARSPQLLSLTRVVRPLQESRALLYFSTAEFNSTVEESLKKWCKVFIDAKISEPLESVANLLAHTLHSNKIGDVYEQRKSILSDLQVHNLQAMCQKRLENMPVQYIIGEWEFRGINLKLKPPVFIPRPETEMLVELVIQHIKRHNVESVLDFCCGSGAVCLSLLKEVPHIKIVTLDKSRDACELCVENARRLNLQSRIKVENKCVNEFRTEDKFDLIVSNPPYVPSNEIQELQPEILLYEDLDALDGGADGLDIIKQIFDVSSSVLNPEGRLFLEVDPSHPDLIADELIKNEQSTGLRFLHSRQDLCNKNRFVEIIKY